MLVKIPLIRQLYVPESIIDHLSHKTKQANTPVTGVNYRHKQGEVKRLFKHF